MRNALDLELQKLLVGTNDQRRRVGQALYHFYRTLVFWMPKGRSFFETTKAWAAGGAAIFDGLAATLEPLGPWERDRRLRAYTANFLQQLAEDLERGDHMLVPFLRWMETLFPELTEIIREEDARSKIYDYDLARELASLFVSVANAPRAEVVTSLRTCAEGFFAEG